MFDLSEKAFQCTTGIALECGETNCLHFVRRSNVFSGFAGRLNLKIKKKPQGFVVFQCLLKVLSRFIQLSRRSEQKVTGLGLHVSIEIKHFDQNLAFAVLFKC